MKNRKQIVIIDVESTCWNDGRKTQSEIIEIGLATIGFDHIKYTELGNGKLNRIIYPLTDEAIQRHNSILIRPILGEVSPFCTHLTGWRQQDLEGGMSYKEAREVLKRSFDVKNCIWASWGKYDDKMFYKMSELFEVPYPFNNDHLNVKALFGAKYGYVGHVGKGLEHFNLEFEGRPHNGGDDAYNIARLLVRLL